MTSSEDEGPHVTVKLEDEHDSRPIPHTSYRWHTTVSSERIVPELERHIEVLKKRRESHAREAELLWLWLAEMDDEYYRACEDSIGLDAEQKEQKLGLFLSLLGVQHVNAWLAVSKMDWAIADARKRIAQHTAQMQEDNGGKVGRWMPRAPQADKAQRPDHALKELNR